MRDVIDILLDRPRVNYTVATVTAVSVATGRVTLSTGAATLPGVPYLLSYSPTVGDKVQVLGGESTGLLVLGKTLATAAPAAPTTRVVVVPADRSMTWIDNLVDGSDTGAVDGVVRQGADVSHLYSGAYSYPAAAVILDSDEIIVKAELLLYRVDNEPAATSSPVIHELDGYAANDSPIIDVTISFQSLDLLPGGIAWAPVPTGWATEIVQGAAIGVAFVPSSAVWALTYSEYADRTVVVDGVSTAGSLRLTIEKGA